MLYEAQYSRLKITKTCLHHRHFCTRKVQSYLTVSASNNLLLSVLQNDIAQMQQYFSKQEKKYTYISTMGNPKKIEKDR